MIDEYGKEMEKRKGNGDRKGEFREPFEAARGREYLVCRIKSCGSKHNIVTCPGFEVIVDIEDLIHDHV